MVMNGQVLRKKKNEGPKKRQIDRDHDLPCLSCPYIYSSNLFSVS